MTRLLFYTDLQLSGKTPRHRVDDYPSALVEKVAEIYERATAERCEFVVFGGDFFNNHKIFSYDVINRVMEPICSSDLTTYVVLGQHDVHGYNPKTYETSTMAFMARHCEKLEVMWGPTEVGEVELWPCHVWEKLEDAKGKMMPPGRVNVLVAHQSITNKKKFFDVESTADFGVGCPYDLVLSGHMHDGYDTHVVDGTTFCNPGAVSRGAMDEIDRVPMVAVIEVGAGRPPAVRLLPIECVKPGSDVFGQDVAEIVRDMSEFDANAFVRGMDELEAESVDVYDLVQKAGKEEGIPKPVLAYIDSKRK